MLCLTPGSGKKKSVAVWHTGGYGRCWLWTRC